MGKSKKAKKKYFTPLTVCLTAVCMLLAAFVLNGYISLNELTLKNASSKRAIEELQSDNSLLSIEIERKNSLASIEQIATEQLGMVKLESYRIHTVNLAGGDNTISSSKDSNITYVAQTNKFYIAHEQGKNVLLVNDLPVIGGGTELKDYDHITIGTTELIFVALCSEKFRWDEKK